MDLIFDIDGTLWDTTDVVAVAWNQAVSDARFEGLKDFHVTGDRLKQEFGKPMNVIADDLFGDIPQDVKDRIMELCCKHENRVVGENTKDLAYPGMRETMKELSKKHRLFIVSNCQKGYIEQVIAKNGLEAYIEDKECYGNTLLSKGENIKLIIERNGLKEPVYIGDTLGDYTSTKEAGIPFVFAAYGFGQVPAPDYTIHKFSDLLTLF